ncbi:recombinase family protein [Nocardia asiatica]|uniref:recombinase family protein n=1 Tax=Nocardia asiatica TaxID=209252 RepID=UPI002455E566|nr:recombinase family protein [Nocardia asiatica]
MEHFSSGEPFRVGYCRCSTDAQDVQTRTDQLLALGVPCERIFIDTGFSGTAGTEILRHRCWSSQLLVQSYVSFSRAVPTGTPTWSGPRRRGTSASPPGSGSPSCPAP